MPIKWREALRNALIGLRDLALTVLIFGVGQVLLSLLVWPLFFRTHPLGLCMALSLVGFGSWFVAFVASFGDRRRQRLTMTSGREPIERPDGGALIEQMHDQVTRSGCGFILLASSLVPLGIAFVLRLQADLRSGLTLRDIFPPMPGP